MPATRATLCAAYLPLRGRSPPVAHPDAAWPLPLSCLIPHPTLPSPPLPLQMLYTTACADDDNYGDGSFAPLQVHYTERFSAAGRTSGGFFKREGKPKDHEVLVSRLIDRPIRPMISAGWTHTTQVLTWVLSYDGQHSPEPLAITAAGAALAISGGWVGSGATAGSWQQLPEEWAGGRAAPAAWAGQPVGWLHPAQECNTPSLPPNPAPAPCRHPAA